MPRKRPKRGRRVSCTGKVYYCYPKRKNGRHKKRGPKPKKVKKERVYPPWDYIIVKTNEYRQSKYVGRFHTIQDAYAKKEELLAQNETVIFPRQTVINFRNHSKSYSARTEYLILKKNEDGVGPNKLRNDYGTLVDHVVSSDKWIICDKFPCLEEETFWVYGFDNKTDRKTADWIYNNLAINKVEENGDIVIVYLYNNKLIFKYDDENFEFVICKNISDAIRLYNFIEEKSKKVKQICMTGATNGRQKRGRETIRMIMQKTGWCLDKVCRRSTRR